MKFNIIVISFCILNSVTPVSIIFQAAGSTEGPDSKPIVCTAHFTNDQGIIFSVKLEDKTYPFGKGEFDRVDASNFSEKDGIIKTDEQVFGLEYSKVGLFYFSKKNIRFDIKVFNKEQKVYSQLKFSI
jgi:hypothetical protein